MICKATINDLKELLAFEQEVFFCDVERFSERRLKQILTTPSYVCLIMKNDDNSICGWLTGSIRNFRIPSGRVIKIVVAEKFRRHGLATQMLFMFESELIKRNVTKVCAEVRESNSASIQLFQKNGYKKRGTLFGYYGCLSESYNLEDGFKFWKDLC